MTKVKKKIRTHENLASIPASETEETHRRTEFLIRNWLEFSDTRSIFLSQPKGKSE